MRTIITFIFCLLATFSWAQDCYYASYADFVADKYTVIDSLDVSANSYSKQLWIGGSDFKLKTGDKETDKILKKAFLVSFHDTLYVNTAVLRFEGYSLGKGFVQAYRFQDDKLCISAPKTGKKAASAMMGASLLGGALAGAVQADKNLKNRVCYLIDSQEEKYCAIKIFDDELMTSLLENHPAELELYNSVEKKKERNLAIHVLPILEKIGLVKTK